MTSNRSFDAERYAIALTYAQPEGLGHCIAVICDLTTSLGTGVFKTFVQRKQAEARERLGGDEAAWVRDAASRCVLLDNGLASADWVSLDQVDDLFLRSFHDVISEETRSRVTAAIADHASGRAEGWNDKVIPMLIIAKTITFDHARLTHVVPSEIAN